MKAYNPAWLDALAVRRLAGWWRRKNWLTEEQLRQIEARYPAPFFTPNGFVRVGLFGFTAFFTLCATGLASLFVHPLLDSGGSAAFGVLYLLYGVGTGGALEYFIRRKHHYRSGIDDALLYFTLALGIGGLASLFWDAWGENVRWYCLLALPILIAGAIRYADRLVTALAYACLLTVVVLFGIRFGWGRWLLPFVGMAVSAGLYGMAKRGGNTNRTAPSYEGGAGEGQPFRYWAGCLWTVELLALLTFYLSGNYFTVREGHAALNDTTDYRQFSNPEIEAIEQRREAYYAEIGRLQTENDGLRADSLRGSQNQARIDANQQRIEANYRRRETLLYRDINTIRLAERERAAANVPLAGFFLGYTFLVPLLYLIAALRRRSRPVLWAGMLTLVLAALTYVRYFPPPSSAIAATAVGTLLIGLAYLSIRLLQKPAVEKRYRLTYRADEDDPSDEIRNAEAGLLAQTFSNRLPTPPDQGTQFGGGDFGGGGAGTRY
ncbi:MAG: hypothetical protein H7Z75_19790 [Ferruginibacter sp.]|nr:hypothetical protein [Cytophagales bacterium]